MVVIDDNVSADLDEKLGKRWWKPSIAPEVLAELRRNDTSWPGIKYVTMYFACLLVTGWLAYVAFQRSSPWAIVFFWLYGTVYAFSGAYDHEARHRTLFASRAANDFFGHIFAFMTNFEPVRWKYTHTLHHAYTLSTREPVDFEIQVDRPSQLVKLVLAFVPFGPLVHVHQSYLAETFMNALGILTPVIRDCVPADAQKEVIHSARVHMAIWAALAAACVTLRSWLPALYFMLPTFYGNTLFALCGLTQHAGLPYNVKDHRLNTRTLRLNPVLSWLYIKLEYHQEHHMFPFVPWHKLPRLHAMIKDQMPPPHDGLAAAWREIIPAVYKQAFDPGYVPPSRILLRQR
jgi:fatty acid desaturase